MHLRELQLCLRAYSLRERGISDDVSQGLSACALVLATIVVKKCDYMPLGLILHVHLPLGVVANIADLREASDVELRRAELRHDGDGGGRNAVSAKCR